MAALLRRLGVTIWEICTGDQPKRGQLRACRHEAHALPGRLAHVTPWAGRLML